MCISKAQWLNIAIYVFISTNTDEHKYNIDIWENI